MEGASHFLINYASVGHLRNLLAPGAENVRIFDHFPLPEMSWWTANVPLSRNGANRKVELRGLQFDLDLTIGDFIEWLDDFEAGGILLVQSEQKLPVDLHPSRFRVEKTYLNVLASFGARLVFELPHAHETAAITLFNDSDIDRIRRNGAAIIEDPYPRQDRWVWSAGR